MFAAEVRNDIKVWVRLGQRADAALVPGIVTDDRVGNRNLIRRGGPLTVQNSVVVISLRENVNHTPGRPDTYTVERPESLIALSERVTQIPAIDGAPGMTTEQVLAALRIAVAMSLAALSPKPSETKVEAEAARYLAMPALVTA